MTSLRSHVARIRHEALAGLRSALNIASPSRVFIDAARSAGRRPHAPPVPLPWYSARGPLEPYETPELAAAARRVRRLIRRHWWALFFEPESSTAASVRAAMATPPECARPTELFSDTRARVERAAYVAIVGDTVYISRGHF